MEEVKKYKEMTCSEDGDRVCPLVKWPAVVVLRKSIIIVDLTNKVSITVNTAGGAGG